MDVLVVDDSAVARAVFKELVTEVVGVRVAGEAASGQEALQRAEERAFDVVVMDWSMPGMDGVEATGRLRAAHPELRVVGWTSTDEAAAHHAFMAAGAEAVFVKERVVPLLGFLSGIAAALR